MAINEITGAKLRSKELSDEGKDNWDRIFGKKTSKSAPIDEEVCSTRKDEESEETV
jgi:hypothetical protein